MIVQIGKLGGECGGICRYTGDVTRELAHRHIPCQTISGSDGNIARRYWSTRRAARSILAGDSVDLIASHFALDALPALRYRRGRPFVCHHHGPWALESKCEGNGLLKVFAKDWIERKVYSQATLIITLSEAFATSLQINYDIERDRIRVIPGGVDLEHFSDSLSRCEARNQLGWPTNRPIVVAVRRLVNRMGLPVFIEAIAEVRRRHPDILVNICGNGRLRDSLAAQIRQLGLEHNINLLGYIEEPRLPLAYRAADFSVVPSLKYEGFGLAAAESLAAGTPALVTNVDGLPEVIGPLSANLIVKPNSKADLGDRICWLLSRPTDFPSSVACRAYAVKHFAWPLIVDRILAVYREAMQQSQSRLSTVRFNDDLPNIAPAG